MRIGLYVRTRGGSDVSAVLERFRRAEERGFHTAWVGQTTDHDALTLLALAGRETRRIELGSWVVPTPPRHPAALAQQALTAQSASGGRLLLGVGASHAAVVEKRLGLDASHPVRDLREYLAVLRPLLAGEAVAFEGAVYRVQLQLETSGAAPPPVLLAALGPRMLALAGSLADGAAIWLGGPRYLEGFALPRLRRAALEAGRPAPRVVAGLPVLVTDAPARGRAAAETFLAESARLPAYRRVLEREGASAPSDVALIGSEEEIGARLDALAALGVTDFNAVVVPFDDEPGAAARTLAFLAARAAHGQQVPS